MIIAGLVGYEAGSRGGGGLTGAFIGVGAGWRLLSSRCKCPLVKQITHSKRYKNDSFDSSSIIIY